MRTIVEEAGVANAIDAAKLKWSRALDSWEALTWVIAHDPECGTALSESGNERAYTFEGARSIGMPTLTVVYEHDRTKIVVKAALFADSKHTQAGRG